MTPLAFDGSNDYLSAVAFDPGIGFSVMAKIRVDGTASTDSHRVIFQVDDSTGPTSNGRHQYYRLAIFERSSPPPASSSYVVTASQSGLSMFKKSEGIATTTTYGQFLSNDKQWVAVMGSWGTVASRSAYGQVMMAPTTYEVGNNTTSIPAITPNQNMLIGQPGDATGGAFFNGDISQVVLINSRIATDFEFKQYAMGASPEEIFTDTIKRFWPLNADFTSTDTPDLGNSGDAKTNAHLNFPGGTADPSAATGYPPTFGRPSGVYLIGM